MASGSSVISLSSSASKGEFTSSESLASIITVSSETQRVPVSWDSGKLSREEGQDLNLESTPNHTEKVKRWMSSCKYDHKGIESPKSEDEICKSTKSTCIRYDFNKSPRSNFVPQSCYTLATPLFSYMEEAKKHRKVRDVPKVETSRRNGNNVHKDGKGDTPLSPESQKTELCNYLQLMKPDDKQHNFFIEYRRSARVKTQNNNESKEKTSSVSQEKVTNDVNCASSAFHLKVNKNNVFSLKRKKDSETVNKLLPLPPKRIYAEVSDFEDCVQEMFAAELQIEKKDFNNGCLKKIEKRRKFNFSLKYPQKLRKRPFIYRRLNLRSKGRLRNFSFDELILRNRQMRKKARKKMIKEFKEKLQANAKKVEKIESPRCEIVSIETNSDDENVDLKNFVDDMLELDKMSEEHRKSVIESRILASSSITNLINKRASHEADVQRAYKIFSDLSNEKKNLEEKENDTQEVGTCETPNPENARKDEEAEMNVRENENHMSAVAHLIFSEHGYANFSSPPEQEEEASQECEDDSESAEGSLSPVPITDLEVLPVNKEVKVKSLHRSLAVNNRRKLFVNNYGLHNWGSGSNSQKLNHSISISKKNGAILGAFYQDYNLVVAQQSLISFWTQSALGNVLGAQNMWIPKGEIQRIALNSTYVQIDAMDMVITTETSVAYVELWTKEHKSDVREVPVADVFATVYFWRLRQSGLDKKALQLENIKGFAEYVQYCVLKCYPRIIVSWHSVQGNEKKTKIHSYHLAADFQTVASISEIQPVEHHVSSLHNIEDCDSLVMGCGDNKITLWNVEYGYIVATIEMSTIKSPLSTLWVKCDRGFLFTIQECDGRELRLIAINGMNHSWKKLQNYDPLPGFDRLKGVCIENGILVAYYAQGILCWNAQTGELIVEEMANECDYIPSGKHVIMIANENIIVRHSLSHLITDL